MKKSTLLSFATAAAIVVTSVGTFALWDKTTADLSGKTLELGNAIDLQILQQSEFKKPEQANRTNFADVKTQTMGTTINADGVGDNERVVKPEENLADDASRTTYEGEPTVGTFSIDLSTVDIGLRGLGSIVGDSITPGRTLTFDLPALTIYNDTDKRFHDKELDSATGTWKNASEVAKTLPTLNVDYRIQLKRLISDEKEGKVQTLKYKVMNYGKDDGVFVDSEASKERILEVVNTYNDQDKLISTSSTITGIETGKLGNTIDPIAGLTPFSYAKTGEKYTIEVIPLTTRMSGATIEIGTTLVDLS